MSYFVLDTLTDRLIEDFNRRRGMRVKMFWNPTLDGGRWVVAVQTNNYIRTMAPLVGVRGIHPERCQYEPMFVCVDKKSGMLKEPGPWIIRELEQRLHRADDTKFVDGMEKRIQAAEARRRDPFSPEKVERAIYTDREMETYGKRGKKHFLIESG